MPEKNKALFVKILRDNLDGLGWSDAKLGQKAGVNRTTVYRWLDEDDSVMPSRENLDKLVQVLKIQDPAHISALYDSAGIPPAPPPTQPPPPPQQPLSAAHVEYLHNLFDRWGPVRLADILDDLKQPVRLLDVYVPLPIDARIRMAAGRAGKVDWWFDRGAAAGDVEIDERRAPQQLKQRTWPELGIYNPAQIQPLIEQLWAAAATEGRQRDQEITVTLDAEHAAALQPHLVLLGGPGSGKSSFLRHLALCMAGALLRSGGYAPRDAADLNRLPGWLSGAYTPIYVELRDLVGSDHFPKLPHGRHAGAPVPEPGIDEFWAYLTTSLQEKGLAGIVLELRQLLRAGKVLLLLDGLDEVNRAHDPGRLQQIVALVAALREAGGPDLRILIASRPHAYDTGAAPLPDFGVARLAALSRPRQEQLAHTLLRQLPHKTPVETRVAQLMAAIDAARVDDDMRENPLFFTLWVGLWHVAREPKTLPASKAGLYRAAVDLLLWRWTQPKKPDKAVIEAIGIDPPALRPVLEALACKTLGQQGEDFPLADLLDLLEEAKSSPDGHYPDEMMIDKVDDYLEQHAGILVSPRKRHYRFIHRSFQEHLAACELTYAAQPPQRALAVRPDHLFPHGLLAALTHDTNNWRNVALLAVSELAANDRLPELWALLVAMCTPYLAAEQRRSPAMALLALEIVNDTELPLPPTESADLLRRAGVLALRDVAAFPNPAQRLIAGDALARLGDRRPGVGLRGDGLPDIAWCKVPATDAAGKREFFYQEGKHPGLPDFWIARYPVTYAQFQSFVDAPDGYRNSRCWQGLAEDRSGQGGTRWQQQWPIANRPRERVAWVEAVAFCHWLSAQAVVHPELLPAPELAARLGDGWSIRLPTEWEWEKAARGWDERRYPWGGKEYKVGYANVDESEQKVGPNNLGQTSAVGIYPQGASPFGAEEMSGNVWEYCLNEYDNPANLLESGTKRRASRGGSWYSNPSNASVSARFGSDLGYDFDLGFRLVFAASP